MKPASTLKINAILQSAGLDCGIYYIKNIISDNTYIDSSVGMAHRLETHASMLRNDHHDNQHLQRAWNKYGENQFVWGQLIFCDQSSLLAYEQLFIDKLFSTGLAYNIAKVAGASMRGLKRTPESLAKASAKLKGRKLSEKHKAKISAAHMGKVQGPHSEEHKKKISDKNRGRKHTAVSIEKMRMVQTGKFISEKQRIQISKSKSKPVERIDPVTGEVTEYKSITLTAPDGFIISCVARCCKGQRNNHKGYYWQFIK